MQWFAQAPANIALIKYMGKDDEQKNLPANPSLSYTLPHLLSSVMLEEHSAKKDFWEPLDTPGALPFQLSLASQERFLHHLAFIKDQFDYQGSFVVRSSNNFPQGSGLASSASSFAALTKCAIRAICDMQKKSIPPMEVIVNLSRQGSGSSCRSFFAPWALWQEDKVEALHFPFDRLIHQAVIISHEEKKISSSKAHQLVKTSSFWASRPERATENLKQLKYALETLQWADAFQICWREFQDMHHLFSTCLEPFTYMTEETTQLLAILEDFWQEHGDGPLVTMDAGPNIHLLYRPDQKEVASQFRQQYLVGNFDVL